MDQNIRHDAVEIVADGLQQRFGAGDIRRKIVPPKRQGIDFPVLLDSGDISTSVAESDIFADFKPAAVGFVFVAPEKREEAAKWLSANKKRLLSQQMELDL